MKTIVDLYRLTTDDLASLERMGKKSAQNCYDSLWSRNPVSLDVFLGALSIPMIGSSTIRLCIDSGYDTLDKILAMSKDEFVAIKGFGPERSRSLYEGLNKNVGIIEGLIEAGVNIEGRKTMTKGKLSGSSFCFTGTMSNPRKTLQDMVESNGGEVKKTVGKV